MPVRKLYFTKNVYFDILESMLHFYFLQKFDFKKIVAKIFTHGRRILLIFSIQTYVKNLWALNWFHVANLQCYKNNENQNRIHQWNERSNFGQNINSIHGELAPKFNSFWIDQNSSSFWIACHVILHLNRSLWLS